MSASELIGIAVEHLAGLARRLASVLRAEHGVLGVRLPFLVWVALAGVAGGAVAYWLTAPRSLRRQRTDVRRAALALLPPHIRRSLDEPPAPLPEASGFASAPAPPAGGGRPPCLFVVQRWRNAAFEELRELAWGHPELVETIWDRRWAGDRRLGRQEVAADRRRSERRLLATDPEATWDDHGFALVTFVGGRPRLAQGAPARPAAESLAAGAGPDVDGPGARP